MVKTFYRYLWQTRLSEPAQLCRQNNQGLIATTLPALKLLIKVLVQTKVLDLAETAPLRAKRMVLALRRLQKGLLNPAVEVQLPLEGVQQPQQLQPLMVV